MSSQAMSGLQAGTVVLWTQNSLPGKTAGTQRWASPPDPDARSAPWLHTGTLGSLEGTACGSHALLVPVLPGCSCLRGGAQSVGAKAGVEKALPRDQTLGPQLTWVRNAALGDQFSEQNPKGPHIRLDSESAEEGSLWGCPLDGELGPWRGRGRRQGYRGWWGGVHENC